MATPTRISLFYWMFCVRSDIFPFTPGVQRGSGTLCPCGPWPSYYIILQNIFFILFQRPKNWNRMICININLCSLVCVQTPGLFYLLAPPPSLCVPTKKLVEEVSLLHSLHRLGAFFRHLIFLDYYYFSKIFIVKKEKLTHLR